MIVYWYHIAQILLQTAERISVTSYEKTVRIFLHETDPERKETHYETNDSLVDGVVHRCNMRASGTGGGRENIRGRKRVSVGHRDTGGGGDGEQQYLLGSDVTGKRNKDRTQFRNGRNRNF